MKPLHCLNKISVITLLFTLFILGASTHAAESKKITIAVIPMGSTHEYWKSIHAGAVQAGQELGVEILWKGPLREDDRNSQIDVVEDMIAKNVSGIILAPIDDTALKRPVENAIQRGIPVVIVDAALKSDQTASFVATDNHQGGVLAGEHLAKLLGGKGKVIMLRAIEGAASNMAREQGFLDAIKKYPGITVASSNQHGGLMTETAYQASENLINTFKGSDGKLTIDGIFTPNEPTTFGMLRALQEFGFAGKVHFVGFDSSPKLVDALSTKLINALVVQNPMKMGYVGTKTLVDKIRGNKIEKRIDTGATVVTLSNMKEPKIAELLHPDLQKWLK